MKFRRTILPLVMASLLTSASKAHASYQIVFDTFNSDFSNPVYGIDGTTRLSGADGWLGQLYVGLTPDRLDPIGRPLPFQTEFNERGFVAGGLLNPIINTNINADTAAFYAFRVWNQNDGSVFDSVTSIDGALIGSSSIESITLRGYDIFSDTPPTIGLPVANLHESFTLRMVPEPTSLWFIGIAASAHLTRRRVCRQSRSVEKL